MTNIERKGREFAAASEDERRLVAAAGLDTVWHERHNELKAFVPLDAYRGAVAALQAIYDRHHMNGDGSAGKVSGDALRALGIDPDRGQ